MKKANAYAHARRTMLALGPSWFLQDVKRDGEGVYGIVAQHGIRNLTVIYSHSDLHDGREWLHVSVTKADQTTPTWEEMMYVKNIFIGDDIEAYQVAPPAERYVSIHDNCLHWWACYTEPGGVLPKFEAGSEEMFGMKSI